MSPRSLKRSRMPTPVGARPLCWCAAGRRRDSCRCELRTEGGPRYKGSEGRHGAACSIQGRMMRTLKHAILALVIAAPSTGAAVAWAETSSGPGSTPAARAVITGVKSWSSPTGTRVVIEFSALVAHVAPDAGASNSVQVTIPEPVTRAAEVPEALRVEDGLVDSVLT